MKKEKSVELLWRRYDQLLAQMQKIGLVLQGTITERTIVKEGLRIPRKKKAYGPYFQWTWKKNGKTVTVNLTNSQAKTYQRAIDNHRKMRKLIREMKALSLKICEATTVGVKKRKLKN